MSNNNTSDFAKKMKALAGIQEGDKKFITNESFSEPDSTTLHPNGIKEMIDPYDPMDANQTVDGYPTSTSDLNADGIDTIAPGTTNQAKIANQATEDYIDDDSIEQELTMEISETELREMIQKKLAELESESLGTTGLEIDKQGSEFPNMEENSSDSLANQHGMNAKPEGLVGEDSQMIRHLAGQRDKTVPLGQHALHSQAANK